MKGPKLGVGLWYRVNTWWLPVLGTVAREGHWIHVISGSRGVYRIDVWSPDRRVNQGPADLDFVRRPLSDESALIPEPPLMALARMAK